MPVCSYKQDSCAEHRVNVTNCFTNLEGEDSKWAAILA